MPIPTLAGLVADFLKQYDAPLKDAAWMERTAAFRQFWTGRVMSPGSDALSDQECDAIISILDANAKGNTRETEVVARTMVPQGAWRRMFNEFRTNKKLSALLNGILEESALRKKAALIDQLYAENQAGKNRLTGPGGIAISAFLAAHDPASYLSILSLKHRKQLIDCLGLQPQFDWNQTSIGRVIVESNALILDGLRAAGLSGSARTASQFCLTPAMVALWKGEHTVKTTDKSVTVTVPTNVEVEETVKADANEIRESLQIQGCLAEIGSRMGLKIWLPKSDRARILKVWKPETTGSLLDELPLLNDDMILKTIEQIDVIWLKGRSIVRAFEVEHTTSVYSGLLRMADLLALQPNMNINLNIVAPAARRDKVFQEIRRPVFQLMEGGPLSAKCSYLSYESVRDLREEKFLDRMSASVIEEFEELADES